MARSLAHVQDFTCRLLYLLRSESTATYLRFDVCFLNVPHLVSLIDRWRLIRVNDLEEFSLITGVNLSLL